MIQFDFSETVLTPQNNRASETILLEQSERLSNNCNVILNELLAGEKVSVMGMMRKYGMCEVRRRCKDIRDSGVLEANGYIMKDEILKNGAKNWWIEKV